MNITGLKKSSLLILGFCITFLCTQKTDAQKKRKLIWSDEFNYTGLPDSTKWDYERGFVRNKEPQYYTAKRKENARVENGYLVIEAHKEHYIHKKDTAQYTSASLITLNKAHFKYGHIELRAKFKASKGMWPAFWMLGINRGAVPWPACGEVDFLEYYRGALHANSVYQGEHKHIWNAKPTKITDLGDDDWDNKFHVYTIDWDKNHIAIYVDGTLLNDISTEEAKNHPKGNNPFREKFYFLINLALGQGKEAIPDDNLPSKYYVDYIRVYKN